MKAIKRLVGYVPTWTLIVLILLFGFWYVSLRLDYTYNVSQAKSFSKIKNDFEWAFDIGAYESKLRTQLFVCVAVITLCSALALFKVIAAVYSSWHTRSLR